MIKCDQHMHSSFSGDSHTEMIDMINAAYDKNLDIICFTDHYDPLFPSYRKDEGPIFDLDVPAYIENAKKVRNDESIQSRIKVRLGIELGIYPEIWSLGSEIINSSPFDFVILSSHTAKKLDPYFPEYWENINPVDGMTIYFEEILENVRNFNDFDVYGHLDYCARYTETTPEVLDINNYIEIFRAIFKNLVEKGKGIEINSGGLRSKLKNFNPSKDILKLYKECGGEIITFGSDAHNVNDIAYGIDLASELLTDVGFKYITAFKERKPEFIKIN